MKNLYRIGIFVTVCIITGLLAVYLFDRFVLNVKDIGDRLPQVYENQEELEANQSTRAYALPTPQISGDQNLFMDQTESIQAVEDGNVQAVHTEASEHVVTKTTVYEIEEYDRHTQKVSVVTERVPAQYIGMNRQELEAAIALYLESPSLKDVERGLTDMRLVSFSSERVMVRKSFYIEPEKDCYYLTEEQGFVVVYYRNMGTLFCETGIEIDDLPARLQREIRQIKMIETEEELYGFLESYSS